MGNKLNRQYTFEFKQQAAELAMRIGSSKAAEQLGVNVANVQRWKTELRKTVVHSSKATKIGLEEENRRLHRENEELKKVNHILKRAAAFFSQDHLK